MIVLFNTCK